MTDAMPIARLKAALSDGSGVYVNDGVDKEAYFASLADDIQQHLCDPFDIQATVKPPGFPDALEGDVIAGVCVAHRAGYWLVYQPDQDRFYCFWGTDVKNLGAHGVFGSPLYCWSA